MIFNFIGQTILLNFESAYQFFIIILI